MTLSNMAIHPLSAETIHLLVDAFEAANWSKPTALFETYLSEQQKAQRFIWVAYFENKVAGYITLKKKSSYPPFQNNAIPEIMDFNVLPNFRNQGIGSRLLETAEKKAFTLHHTVGLGVGLYPDYGQALKLYFKNGYQPDGLGVTYQYQAVAPGSQVTLDDDLVLWFTKSR